MGEAQSEKIRHEKILHYWNAVEIFTPATVPKLTRTQNATAQVRSVREGQLLPWERPARARKGRVWQYTVYAGVFEVRRFKESLQDIFRAPPDPALDGRPPTGHSALLCFTVNQDGLLIKDSPMLCSSAWALSRTLDPGPQDSRWLEGFEADAKLLLNRLLQLGDSKLSVISVPPGSAAGGPEIAGGTRWLGRIAGVAADVVLGVAQSEVGVLAGVVGAGVGGLLGTAAAKTVEVLGDKLIDTAREQATASVLGDGIGDTLAPQDARGVEASALDNVDDENLGLRALDIRDLAAITRWVAEQLGVGEVLSPDAIRIKSVQVSERFGDDSGGEELLNSFYAEDLERVASAARKGNVGAALTRYLARDQDIDPAERIDVRENRDAVYENVAPLVSPLGAWPVNSAQPMALSQQFAVNRIMAELGPATARGLYSVNGPPGTGKTYMLRDLIAAIVVERAEKLAQLPTPDACLVDAENAVRWSTADGTGRSRSHMLRPLVADLTGYEIVVASSNNGAVENVSLKTPALDALGQEWRDVIRYLDEPAQRMIGDATWGAIAARLGRRKYRHDFVQDFWWGQVKPGESAPEPGSVPGADKGRSGFGLHDLLMAQAGWDRDLAAVVDEDGDEAVGGEVADEGPPPLGDADWASAVANFDDARNQVLQLVAARQEVAALLARFVGPDALLAQAAARASTAEEYRSLLLTRVAQFRRDLDSAVALYESALEAAGRARRQAQVCQDAEQAAVARVQGAEADLAARDKANRRPARLIRLLNSASDRRWHEARALWVDAVVAADEHWREREVQRGVAESTLHRCEQALSQAAAAVRHHRREVETGHEAVGFAADRAEQAHLDLARRRSELEYERQRLEDARAAWGECFPRAEDWNAELSDRGAMERRELSAPWMDPELLKARTRLFAAALDLHRALLANAPETMRKNFIPVMEIVKGSAPPELPPEAARAAWQLLFLVVPVISTTFASLDRMFAGLGAEALGWVLIDEAGQAAPQHAVGAIWRAQRAVVVGDPLQLEPVGTLPFSAQSRLCAHFKVDRRWAPGLQSAQTIADRVATYGTWIPAGDDRVWVGSPLRVHRRCERLMFDVSNAIAYGGLMVYGNTREVGADYELVKGSVWTHVPALPGGEKWNPEEGEMARRLLEIVSRRVEERLRGLWSLRPVPEAQQGLWRWGHEPAPPDEEELKRKVRQQITKDVFVISPFVDVAVELRRELGDYFAKDTAGDRIGTVHVTQGKEADIVVFVLGTGADADGSRNWASERPNLLNVALTRAVKRLVVIGDLDRWAGSQDVSGKDGFDVLARHADLRKWRPRYAPDPFTL